MGAELHTLPGWAYVTAKIKIKPLLSVWPGFFLPVPRWPLPSKHLLVITTHEFNQVSPDTTLLLKMCMSGYPVGSADRQAGCTSDLLGQALPCNLILR